MPDTASRLLFCSYPTTAPHLVILDIVRVAEARNATLACSGLLAYGNAGYMQMIEGPAPAIDALFSSISHDKRHRIIWSSIAHDHPRLISPDLPMGYVSMDNEGLRLMLTPETCATTDLVELLDAGKRKYPSAMVGP